MLDRYLLGSATRLSPEAPVPVVDIHTTLESPGGAGNVAVNALSLRAETVVIGTRGDDPEGEALLSAFDRHNHVHLSITEALGSTVCKTRVIAGQHHVVRLDTPAEKEILRPYDECRVVGSITAEIFQFCPELILVSDYDKGFWSEDTALALRDSTASLRMTQECLVAVDCKPKNVGLFFRAGGSADIFKPNEAEARALGVTFGEDDTVHGLNALFERLVGCQEILITRADQGVCLAGRDGSLEMIPATARTVYDVTGAGDTVLVVYGMLRRLGMHASLAAAFANRAAGEVIQHTGTAFVTPEFIRRGL